MGPCCLARPRGFEPLAFGFVATESEQAPTNSPVDVQVSPSNQAESEESLSPSGDPAQSAPPGQREFLAAGLLQVGTPQLPEPTPELFIEAGASAADNALGAGIQRAGVQDIIKRALDQAGAIRGDGK